MAQVRAGRPARRWTVSVTRSSAPPAMARSTRAWAIAVAVSGISYDWHTFPAFVAECRARLLAILIDAAASLR